MRIALVSEHASPLAAPGHSDGESVQVAELAAGLVRLGHDVTVYTRRDDPDCPTTVSSSDGYQVVHLAAGPARRLPRDELWPHMREFARELGDWFDLTRPDVAHAHFWLSAWATSRAASARHIPWFVSFHGLGVVQRRHQGDADTSPVVRQHVERTLVRNGEVIATCSEEMAELIALGGNPHRIAVLPCGVDLQRFTPDPQPRPPSGHPFQILSVGRLAPHKGFDLAIRALTDVPGSELLIAGGPGGQDMDSDPEAGRLRGLAAELRVADRVRFLGPVRHEDMPALFGSADVVVCAPWYEPFGIVAVEAMACGVPVVATAVGGLLDTVADGVTGRHIAPGDAAALASAINALRTAPRRRSAYGRAARHLAESCYSSTWVAQRTAALYQAAAAIQRDRPPRAVSSNRLKRHSVPTV